MGGLRVIYHPKVRQNQLNEYSILLGVVFTIAIRTLPKIGRGINEESPPKGAFVSFDK